MITAPVCTYFRAAVGRIIAGGVSRRELCRTTGINRMTLTKLLASPEDDTAEVAVKASWLAAICLRYHVSPAFLLLGSGPMFCGEGCPLNNRRGQ